MVTVSKSIRQLAEIAEKSPNYTPSVLAEDGKTYELSAIQFARTPNGRRNRAVVLATYSGQEGRFDSDTLLQVID